MRAILFALMAMFSVCAIASDTVRIDGRIVTTGMSVAEVIDRAGEPSRTVRVENAYGAAIGERWEYWRGKKQYSIWLSRGKVARVEEL